MSLMHAMLMGDTAVVGCDTACRDADDGPQYETSKISVLAHLSAVFVSVGWLAVHWTAGYHLSTAGKLRGFDELADAMPDMMKAVWAGLAPHAMEGIASTLMFVGWSDRHQACVAHVFDQRPDGEREFVHSIVKSGLVMTPNGTPGGQAFQYTGIDSIKRLAEAQVETGRSIAPGRAIGGRLIVAEIGRDHVNVQTAGSL